MQRYNPSDFEQKWQQKWEQDGTYTVDLSDHTKPKYIGFSMLPGITGAGIHIGHGRTFQFSDIKVRAKRQQGFNAYHPIGWDSFGLPVENYAIKIGKKPRIAHDEAKQNFIKQLKRLGFSYDWSKEISTADPEYYRWTQWIFNKLFEQGLAYQKVSPQWWCETDNTVLANEQVINGRCWRCDNLVTKRNLKQWFFKITEYADEILDATDDLDWTPMVKTMQKNWIGKSVGAEVEFIVGDTSYDVKDTLKFQPELVQQIYDGTKWNTVRREAKNLAINDFVKLQARYSETEVSSFAIAQITNVEKKVVKDIPNDLAGNTAYASDAEKLADYQKYYGNDITEDTEFIIYSFEKKADIVRVFTTRPDTLFGNSFLVLAPEHQLAKTLASDEQRQAVEDYISESAKKSEIDRMNDSREKTGVFTGAYAINPINDQKIPIWVADYVLNGYGTGAIMAVPAHDERDGAFAEKFDLPMRQVVAPQLHDQINPPRDDKENTTRNVVMCVIEHPSDGTFATLRWKKFDWHNFVMGGIENGEDVKEAALREIKEETGFDDVAYVDTLPLKMNSVFYAAHKDVNRNIFTQVLRFKLKSLSQVATAKEEHEDFETEWTKFDDLEKLQPLAEKDYILRWLKGEKIVYHGDGVLLNSGAYDGSSSAEAREQIVAHLARKAEGSEKTTYKMRDWLISRQRYWGAPIPIIHCPDHGAVAVPDDQLPVLLPDVENYKPTDGNTSALAGVEDWVNTTCPTCGGPAKRETDTMDGYACSSWYFLRYMDPFNNDQAWDPAVEKHWGPIDFYNGADHAVAHLLYARFWMRFFYKMGLTSHPEPFKRMMYNAYILAPDGNKMSKSKGNVIDPMEIMDSGYGADSLRVYEMFIAPYDQDAPWDPRGVPGTYRFLNRLWTLTGDYIESTSSELSAADEAMILKTSHRTIKKVTEDIEADKFNTAVSIMMEAVNTYYKIKTSSGVSKHDSWKFALESLLQVLAPFAPHMTEELWQQMGHTDTIHIDHWPAWDDALTVDESISIAIQINGKLRGEIAMPKDASKEDVEIAALAHENVAKNLADKKPTRIVYVPGRLVNIVL